MAAKLHSTTLQGVEAGKQQISKRLAQLKVLGRRESSSMPQLKMQIIEADRKQALDLQASARFSNMANAAAVQTHIFRNSAFHLCPSIRLDIASRQCFHPHSRTDHLHNLYSGCWMFLVSLTYGYPLRQHSIE